MSPETPYLNQSSKCLKCLLVLLLALKETGLIIFKLGRSKSLKVSMQYKSENVYP